MNPLGVAVFLAGMLLAQQATASSFVVLGDPPAGPSPSVIVLGEPALGYPPIVSAQPDETIRTAALPRDEAAPQNAAPALSSFEGDARPSAEWPPRLSVSMVALGEPAPTPSPTAASARRNGFFNLPVVIRGGFVGDAPSLAATPPAAVEPPARERTRTRTESKPAAPAVAEQRGSQPPERPSRRNRTPAPIAPPPAHTPPPPPTHPLQ